MRIKDIEILTGLSQRSIRLYEEKGLLDVRRDEDNQYRSYSEEDIKRLKLIRVLRYFDFSIDEIRDLVSRDGNTALIDALTKKADSFADKVDDYEIKTEQCRNLVKDIRKTEDFTVFDDYIEMIGALHDENVKDLKELTKQAYHPSLGATLLWTFILSGPVLTGMLTGVNSKIHILLIAGSSALMAFDWAIYIRGRSRRKEYQKNRDKGSLWIFAAIIITIAVLLAFAMGLDAIRIRFLDMILGSAWVFYEERIIYIWVLFIGLGALISYPIKAILYKITGNDDYSFGKEFLEDISRHKIIAIIVFVILMYVGFMGITVATEDSIVCFDALHPSGDEYEIKKIESVETGFTKRGDFYYKVKLPNNKIAKFEAPSVNVAYYPEYKDTESYRALEDFDAKLMALGIHKTIDTENISNADYDESCMESFLRIVTIE